MFPLQNGAHTIIQDIQKYRQVFSTSTLNPFPNHIFAKGTAVDYKEATTYAKDPLVRSLALASLSLSVERVDRCVARAQVKKLRDSAKKLEDYPFTPAMIKSEVRPEILKVCKPLHFPQLVRGLLCANVALCRLQYIDDTYSRLAKGEVDPMDELGDTVRDVQVDTNHRFNSLGAPAHPDRSFACALLPPLACG